LKKFDEKLKEFYSQMKKEEFYKYGNGAEDSQKRISRIAGTIAQFY
jgi:hypothetical protein